jgi:hypothetical protein
MENGLQTYFLLVGIALLMLAIFLFYRRVLTTLKGVTVIGRIVDHEIRTIDDSTSYLPIVEFIDQQGKEIRFTSVAGDSDRYPKIGSEVRICYLRSNPKIAYIKSFLHMWAAPIVCAILGLAATISVFWV